MPDEKATSGKSAAPEAEELATLDATDMDMIRRGDMLGPRLGALVAAIIIRQAARIAEIEEKIGPDLIRACKRSDPK